MITFDEVVDAGIKILDIECPDWMFRVNTDTLDMMSPHDCILGQLYKGYAKGQKVLNLSDVDLINCGFTLRDELPFYLFGRLGDAWKKRITNRIG